MFFFMPRLPPSSTRTSTLFPSTTHFRSGRLPGFLALGGEADVGRPEACDKGVDLVGGRLFAICPDGQQRADRKGAARLGDDADEAAFAFGLAPVGDLVRFAPGQNRALGAGRAAERREGKECAGERDSRWCR